MKGHIEEGAWVCCSMDCLGTPRQLGRRRSQATVQRRNGNYLLTKVDSAITTQFTCNSPIKWITGLAAMAITVVALASGPVGWVALGAAAAIAIATVVASHSCNSALGGVEWMGSHKMVKYDGEEAILYMQSTLRCPKGGLLIACETYEQANYLSNQMAINNWVSNTINIGENVINGLIGGPIYCAVNFIIEIALAIIDNQTLSLVNSGIPKPETASAYTALWKSPRLSGMLIKEWILDSARVIKGVSSNLEEFIAVMKVAPRLTMQMAISDSLLAASAKGLGKGIAAYAVTTVADEIEEWIQDHNKALSEELKELDSKKNILSLNYIKKDEKNN